MKHTRTPTLLTVLTALLVVLLAAAALKPNILVIFTDDLDFEEVGALADDGDAALAGKPPGKPQRPLGLACRSRSNRSSRFHPGGKPLPSTRLMLMLGHSGRFGSSPRRENVKTLREAGGSKPEEDPMGKRSHRGFVPNPAKLGYFRLRRDENPELRGTWVS